MSKLIGNPVYWGAQIVGAAGAHAAHTAEAIGGDDSTAPITEDQIRRLSFDDLREALREGLDDFAAARADVIFLALIYPIVGLLLAAFAMNADLVPLLFPLIAGFALIGPMAAVGLYEISRRREIGLPYSWGHVLTIATRPSFGSILVLGLYHMAIFGLWMLAAHTIYGLTMATEAPVELSSFLNEVLTTAAGWSMILIGCAVGFAFALLVLATSVVSFPLLLHRNVGVPNALVTSVRVFLKNPRVICAWGLIVAGGLALGAIPALIGLVVVLPVLGHATWRLYRRAVRT